jgi:hypothetical protein
METHSFTKKIKGIYYCAKCGLVYLNNDFTRWCIKRGCEYDVHADYAKARIRYTGRH